jgi:alkylation response protein AidB-like acyl-CoA dehydrogenase
MTDVLPDLLLDDDELLVRDEVRRFVAERVSSDLVTRMDRDEVVYPKEFVADLGAENLLGLRFPKEYGGRSLSWRAEIAALEEVGILGTSLGCAFSMPSIVGAAILVNPSGPRLDGKCRLGDTWRQPMATSLRPRQRLGLAIRGPR